MHVQHTTEVKYAPIRPRGSTLVVSSPENWERITRQPDERFGRWVEPEAMPIAVPEPTPFSACYPNHPLTEARLKRGLTVGALARLIGFEEKTVQRWIAGRHLPSWDGIDGMARLFGVDERVVRSWFD